MSQFNFFNYEANRKAAHEIFDHYVDDFILNNNSFLFKETDVYPARDIIRRILAFFRDNIEQNKSYNDIKSMIMEKENTQTICYFLNIEWLWYAFASDIKINTKMSYIADQDNYPKLPLLNSDDLIAKIPNGFISTGQNHNQKKEQVLFLLMMFSWIEPQLSELAKEEKKDSIVKNKIVTFCLTFLDLELEKDKNEQPTIKRLYDDYKSCVNRFPYAMINIMLHMADEEEFEDIGSSDHKNRIVNTFQSTFDLNETSQNKKIKEIKSKIETLAKQKFVKGFYEDFLLKLWLPTSFETQFNELQALSYKKSIILYGPPGTSKTHSAEQIAESMILNHLLKDQNNWKDYISNPDNFIDEYVNGVNGSESARLTRLQMHTNYNYEDFIAGIELNNQKTQAKKGDLLELCERLNKENEGKSDAELQPHILILDEINRVDLSRLFGEFFSAIENRGKPIKLGVGGFTLNVPKNLYIIGTMNEIDFSLERIDFALRRRFVWFFKGFDEQVLRDMLYQKIDNEKTIDQLQEVLTNYIECVVNLNHEITTGEKLKNQHHLGKQYQIGHSFFAEIADIYKEIRTSTKQQKKTSFKTANEILWNISIMPMIEAYLGNLDQKEKQKVLKSYKEIFLGK